MRSIFHRNDEINNIKKLFIITTCPLNITITYFYSKMKIFQSVKITSLFLFLINTYLYKYSIVSIRHHYWFWDIWGHSNLKITTGQLFYVTIPVIPSSSWVWCTVTFDGIPSICPLLQWSIHSQIIGICIMIIHSIWSTEIRDTVLFVPY